jgi:hypothetical protein
MTKNDERLIEASIHYAIAECGGLARVTIPKAMIRRTKIGVGFDSVSSGGYLTFFHRISWRGLLHQFYSHRMIYYLHHGEIPRIIDHIDGDKSNNSIENLRACSHQQNMRNSNSRKNSSSKYLGVNWDKRREKWRAKIKVDVQQSHLGYFTCEKEAARAYNKAAAEHFGEFANLNIIEGGEE